MPTSVSPSVTSWFPSGGADVDMDAFNLWGQQLEADLVSLFAGAGKGQNILINGDMQLNQRAFAGGALSTGVYGFDRWKASGASDVSVSGYVITLASGTIVQVVERALWCLTNFASTQITISVDTPSADLTVAFGSVSGTITAGAGRRSVTLTTGAGDTGDLSLTITKATAGSVTFGRVKAELGAVSTPWVPRPRAVELLMAKRYYRRVGGDAAYDVIGQGGNASLGTIRLFSVFEHPVRMRAAPSLIVSDVLKFTILAGSSTFATTDVTLHGGVNNSMDRTTLVFLATGMTTGQFGLVYSDGTTNAWVAFSAEL